MYGHVIPVIIFLIQTKTLLCLRINELCEEMGSLGNHEIQHVHGYLFYAIKVS